MAQSKHSPTHNFGQKLAELEELTSWFESDKADLDSGLEKFERGMQLIGELKADLAQAENKIEQIKAKFDGPEASADWGEPEIGLQTPVASDINSPGLF